MCKINIGGFNIEPTKITKVVSGDRKIKKNILNILLFSMLVGLFSIARTLYEWDFSMLFPAISIFSIAALLFSLIKQKMRGKFITVFIMNNGKLQKHTKLFLGNNHEQRLQYKDILEKLKKYT